MRSNRVFLALIFASVLTHAAAMTWVKHREGRIDAFAFNSLDCDEYFAIAGNIVQHGTFSQNDVAPLLPDTWRTPGYPLFLAAGMLLVGDSPTALVLIQQMTAIGSVLIFFKIASKHFSPGRAEIASLIFLLEPYHLFYSFWLLSTTFFTFVLLLTWWTWERARESVTLRHCVTLGLLSGSLVLIWPGAILIPFMEICGFLLRPLPNRKIVIALVVAGCLLPPVSWMTRNKVVAGHFALSHQSGIVLAYFKATEVELWRQGRTEDRYLETSLDPARRNEPHTVWEGIDADLSDILDFQSGGRPICSDVADSRRLSELSWLNLAQGSKTSFDSFEVSRILSWIAASMLMKSPLDTISCGAVRIVENLTFPLDLVIKPAKSTPVNRIKAAALGVVYTLLFLAAVVGAFRAKEQWATLYFPAACIIALALTTAPQIDPRFRVPLIPCLAFLALLPSRRAES